MKEQERGNKETKRVVSREKKQRKTGDIFKERPVQDSVTSKYTS